MLNHNKATKLKEQVNAICTKFKATGKHNRNTKFIDDEETLQMKSTSDYTKFMFRSKQTKALVQS